MSVGIRKRARSPGFWPRIIAVLAALTTVSVAAGWWIWMGWAPPRGEYPVQGVSVSSDHGEIGWGSVRAQGADFAYIRATSGADRRDPAFARNWESARQAGLRYGAELIYDPCSRAIDQATLFITTVPRDNAALPPAIRLDTDAKCAPGRDRILSELNTLINLVEAHSGKAALLHVSETFEQSYDIGGGINRTLWLDRNFFPPNYTERPWVMWTASDARRIEGISGPVEWDVVAP